MHMREHRWPGIASDTAARVQAGLAMGTLHTTSCSAATTWCGAPSAAHDERQPWLTMVNDMPSLCLPGIASPQAKACDDRERASDLGLRSYPQGASYSTYRGAGLACPRMPADAGLEKELSPTHRSTLPDRQSPRSTACSLERVGALSTSLVDFASACHERACELRLALGSTRLWITSNSQVKATS
jgi:hypothetical protein